MTTICSGRVGVSASDKRMLNRRFAPLTFPRLQLSMAEAGSACTESTSQRRSKSALSEKQDPSAVLKSAATRPVIPLPPNSTSVTLVTRSVGRRLAREISMLASGVKHWNWADWPLLGTDSGPVSDWRQPSVSIW